VPESYLPPEDLHLPSPAPVPAAAGAAPHAARATNTCCSPTRLGAPASEDAVVLTDCNDGTGGARSAGDMGERAAEDAPVATAEAEAAVACNEVTCASDATEAALVWGFGVVMLEMLFGPRALPNYAAQWRSSARVAQ